MKKFTIPNVNISSAANVIPVTSVSSSAVESTPASEWASFAARYQQYRVRKITLVLHPSRPIQDGNGNPSEFLCGDYIGSATPASAAQVLSDENVMSYSMTKTVRHVVTWSRNPNAKLWNPTSAAIPAANTYSLVFCSSSAAILAVGTNMVGHYEYEVELRGSQ